MKSDWSDTSRYPDMFGLDARALVFLSAWMLHWSWNTFYFAIAGMLFFWIALRHGATAESFVRKIINYISRGNRDNIDSVVYRRRTHW